MLRRSGRKRKPSSVAVSNTSGTVTSRSTAGGKQTRTSRSVPNSSTHLSPSTHVESHTSSAESTYRMNNDNAQFTPFVSLGQGFDFQPCQQQSLLGTLPHTVPERTCTFAQYTNSQPSGQFRMDPHAMQFGQGTTGQNHTLSQHQSGLHVGTNSHQSLLGTGTPTTSQPVTQSDHITTGNIHVIQQESVEDDIALNVSPNLQEKIQKGEYINLALLLSNSRDINNVNTHKFEIINGELVMNPKKHVVTINSIEQWTSAFIVYMYVYCKIHGSRCLELLKYMQTIRLGAKRLNGSLGWKYYDEQYRLRKSSNPSSSWSKLDYELWLLHMNASQSNIATVSPSNSNNSVGKCFAFNYEGNCKKPDCQYKHTCIRCSFNHPIISCRVRINGNNSSYSYSPRVNQQGSANVSTGVRGNYAFRPRGYGPRFPVPRQGATNYRFNQRNSQSNFRQNAFNPTMGQGFYSN